MTLSPPPPDSRIKIVATSTHTTITHRPPPRRRHLADLLLALVLATPTLLQLTPLRRPRPMPTPLIVLGLLIPLALFAVIALLKRRHLRLTLTDDAISITSLGPLARQQSRTFHTSDLAAIHLHPQSATLTVTPRTGPPTHLTSGRHLDTLWLYHTLQQSLNLPPPRTTRPTLPPDTRIIRTHADPATTFTLPPRRALWFICALCTAASLLFVLLALAHRLTDNPQPLKHPAAAVAILAPITCLIIALLRASLNRARHATTIEASPTSLTLTRPALLRPTTRRTWPRDAILDITTRKDTLLLWPRNTPTSPIPLVTNLPRSDAHALTTTLRHALDLPQIPHPTTHPIKIRTL